MGFTQVETGGIKDDAISSGKIPDNAVGTSEIADGAVTLAKLADGDNDSDGKVLTSNDGSAPTFNTPTIEGTAVKSTGETNTSKFLGVDGDNTCSWKIPVGTTVVSADANGLAPQRPETNQPNVFLRGDATWATPPYQDLAGTDKGLLRQLPTTGSPPAYDTSKFLRGDGNWAEVVTSDFTGATTDPAAAGTAGLVPAPASGDGSKYLKGDGTWDTPTDTNTQVTVHDSASDGSTAAAISSNWAYDHNAATGNGAHVPTASGSDAGKYLKADGTWDTPNSYNLAEVGADGLLKELPTVTVDGVTSADTTKFIRGDNTWVKPSELYHDDGTTKLSTTSTGVTIGGALATGAGTSNFGGNISINTIYPTIVLNDTNSDSDFKIINSNGIFTINDSTNSANRFTIDSNGLSTFENGLTVKDASGSDPTFLLKHSALDVVGEVARIGRTDSTVRYHSIKAKNSGTAADNLISFNLHDGSGDPYTGQDEVLKLQGDGQVTIDGNLDVGAGLDVTGNITSTGTLEAKAIRYGDSHVKRISVDYTGEETGEDGVNYLIDNEFQEILTITPDGNSENYSVIGRIMAASGANVHTLDVNIALRSNTLPDLHITGSYISTITGSTEYLTPRLWLKETTTAAFKLVVEINAQIYGRVTADLEIIARNESDLDNIVVNEDETSEVTELPTGYAQTTPTKIYETDDGDFAFTSDLTSTGDIKLDNINKSIQVGDITNDNYLGLSHVNSSTVRGFTIQHGNASVLENLQGGTNQYIVLGDVNNDSTDTLFGVSMHQGGTTYPKLTLAGNGDLDVGGVLTTDGLAVDTDTLFVNTSLNRVGIGTSAVGATLHLSSALPEIRFTDTDDNNIDHWISCSGSAMVLKADESQEDNAGDTTIRFHVDGAEIGRFNDAGLDVTGDITVSGEVDGVDIAALKTKVDAKEFFSITNTGTVAGTWLGSHDDISSYFDGMTIAFYTDGTAGIGSGTTLNINNLGAKDIYYADGKTLGTNYGPRALIMLQYDASEDRFYAHDFYYTDTYRLRWATDMQVGDISVTNSRNRIDGYQLLMEGIDGKMYPVTVCKSGETAYNTITDNPVQTAELRVGGLMLLYESGGNRSPNLILSNNNLYTGVESPNMAYWSNRASTSWATEKRPWYIVATMNANGNFVLDNSSTTAFLTQDLPSSDDGKFYIKGGWMEDDIAEYRLQVDHPIYVYKNGAVRTYAGYSNASTDLYHSGTSKITATSGGVTVTGSVTTQDINLSNLNASTPNEVDSTRGSWTIQEGADNLFLINRSNNKKYKFNLTEIS